jgi:hypothetical protein
MAFGQVSGSPASAKQVRELLDLLQAAGHSDFRDARGPMRFTQRQAGGKFSRDEAQAFIDQLEEEAQSSGAAPAPVVAAPKPAAKSAPKSAPKAAARTAPAPAAEPSGRPLTPMERALRAATGDQLADELRRRGWRTVER